MIEGVSLSNIRNRYEIKVIDKMKQILPQYPDFDGCSLCIEDVYSLSLSRMPAVYTHRGSVILHRTLTEKDIEEVVHYAIMKVMMQPKHG